MRIGDDFTCACGRKQSVEQGHFASAEGEEAEETGALRLR